MMELAMIVLGIGFGICILAGLISDTKDARDAGIDVC